MRGGGEEREGDGNRSLESYTQERSHRISDLAIRFIRAVSADTPRFLSTRHAPRQCVKTPSDVLSRVWGSIQFVTLIFPKGGLSSTCPFSL